MSMEAYETFVKAVFDSFKCMRRHDLLRCIPIYDEDEALVGYLRPITRDYRESLHGCAQQLALWRNANPSLSAEPFTATEETTEDWLDYQVIGRADRLLFYIVLIDHRRVGHIGFSSFDYSARCCEVDAVLRGEKDALPGIMTFALRALIRWGLAALRLKAIELRVFSDNGHAIAYYTRNSFVSAKEDLPMPGAQEKRYIRMRLDAAAWRRAEKKRRNRRKK